MHGLFGHMQTRTYGDLFKRYKATCFIQVIPWTARNGFSKLRRVFVLFYIFRCTAQGEGKPLRVVVTRDEQGSDTLGSNFKDIDHTDHVSLSFMLMLTYHRLVSCTSNTQSRGVTSDQSQT